MTLDPRSCLIYFKFIFSEEQVITPETPYNSSSSSAECDIKTVDSTNRMVPLIL